MRTPSVSTGWQHLHAPLLYSQQGLTVLSYYTKLQIRMGLALIPAVATFLVNCSHAAGQIEDIILQESLCFTYCNLCFCKVWHIVFFVFTKKYETSNYRNLKFRVNSN